MKLTENTPILFTRQKHEAKRAGLHYDYRIVIGDKAYSWATRKELPKPGKSIILHEQPVHTAHYALTPEIHIPAGQYGAGVTILDWVGKGIAKVSPNNEHYVIDLDSGERFMLKQVPKYGPKQWLFMNQTGIGKHAKKPTEIEKAKEEGVEKKAMANKYLEKIADFRSDTVQALNNHHDRHEEIEEPIKELWNLVDNVSSYNDDDSEDYWRDYNINAMTIAHEKLLRDKLDTDSQHSENDISTAKAILRAGSVNEEVTPEQASMIIRDLNRVPHGHNGYQRALATGSFLSTLGGVASGAIAGNRMGGGLGAALGAAGGAIAGGVGGYHGLKALLANKIAARDQEIDQNYEGDLKNTFESLKYRLSK